MWGRNGRYSDRYGLFLKHKNPGIKIVAVEPAGFPVISEGRAGSHGIQEINAVLVPEVLDRGIYDVIITMTESKAYETGKKAVRKEGISVKISSSATLVVTSKIAKRPENKGKMIEVLLPATASATINRTVRIRK